MKPYKLAVVIGRFQIFHNGHKGLIDHALEIADRAVVVIGSSGADRSDRNPFTEVERAWMIHGVYPTAPIMYHLQDDRDDNAVWAEEVAGVIDHACLMYGVAQGPAEHGVKREEVALVGYRKDATSFYLDLFPQYTFVPHEAHYALNSTDLRAIYFGMKLYQFDTIKKNVPEPVFNWLMDWMFKEMDAHVHHG